MRNYKRYKTTMGRKYYMRMCEDEKHDRRLFRAALVVSPLIAVFGFAAAAGMI